MKLFIILSIIQRYITMELDKTEFCNTLNCEGVKNVSVCGLRAEENGFRLKLFKNECELMKYGCSVDEKLAYGLINKEYCQKSFADFNGSSDAENNKQKLYSILFHALATGCEDYKCINVDTNEVCGIRQDGGGFRIRLFNNKCEILKYNCENVEKYNETDLFICKQSLNFYNNSIQNGYTNNDENYEIKNSNVTNLIVVNANILGEYDNVNDTIDTFFAASHVFDMPMKEIQPLNTRRKLLKYAGPVKVFVPWIVKPENISNDTFHTATLSSCYHKCPTKCPDTYAPVCGVPGIVAREPSIMFQNHCFMDVAQCKMFWEGKSSTAHSSSYVEASFLFCMGDEMNAVYRFLPAIRTLQHMGRLKKKGKFRAKLRNFRYVSEFRSGRPKFMG